MNETVVPQVVRSYLEQLKTALREVPEEVSREIVDGITEELAGLDAATAAARIEELGDPVFIAAEARAGTTQIVPAVSRTGDPRWYTVLTALLVALGGIVIPFLGWIVGIAMVWLSKTWRTREKWVATLTAPLAMAAAMLVSVLIDRASIDSRPTNSLDGSTIVNPIPSLIPNVFDTWWSSVLMAVVINVIVGIWLLWRALRSDSERLTRRERRRGRCSVTGEFRSASHYRG